MTLAYAVVEFNLLSLSLLYLYQGKWLLCIICIKEPVQSTFLDWSFTSMISGPAPHNAEGRCMNPYFFHTYKCSDLAQDNHWLLFSFYGNSLFRLSLPFTDVFVLFFLYFFIIFQYLPSKITIEGNSLLLCLNERGRSILSLYQVLPSKCR